MKKNKFKRKRIIFVASIFLISLISLFFVIKNFKENIVFFYTPSELQELTSQKINREIRIGGLVEKSSVIKVDSLTTNFILTDKVKNVKVSYRGILPDLFRENQGVVAKGRFDKENNLFTTSELLIKHDEKYNPPEINKKILNR
jgi:cytochrome c-type biogenesis protein CcmE